MSDKFESIINSLKNNVQPSIVDKVQNNSGTKNQSSEGTKLITEGLSISMYAKVPEDNKLNIDSEESTTKK